MTEMQYKQRFLINDDTALFTHAPYRTMLPAVTLSSEIESNRQELHHD